MRMAVLRMMQGSNQFCIIVALQYCPIRQHAIRMLAIELGGQADPRRCVRGNMNAEQA